MKPGEGVNPVHLVHHSFNRGGGMEQYALTLASSLKELGRHVIFHARKADPALAQSLGVELDCVPVSRFPRKLQDYRFFKRVERLREEAVGLQIALTRVPVRDAVICGGTHRGYLQRSRKCAGPFDWLQIRMEERAYQSAQVVVSHSNLCSEDLAQRYRLPSEKVITLFPPVGSGFKPPSDAHQRTELRRKLGWPEDKVVFLFPSMGHRRKGLKPICRALRNAADDLVLAVAGKSSGSHGGFVRDLGYVENMAEAYQAADYTILGSYYEPFGLVGPESIMCGTRLVFEEHIGCLAAVKPEYVFTFSVWNAETIRGAVRQAIALARHGGHRIARPADALKYNASAVEHARALMNVVERTG